MAAASMAPRPWEILGVTMDQWMKHADPNAADKYAYPADVQIKLAPPETLEGSVISYGEIIALTERDAATPRMNKRSLYGNYIQGPMILNLHELEVINTKIKFAETNEEKWALIEQAKNWEPKFNDEQ